MLDKTPQIATLIDKAASAENPLSALQFSQAACNVANAIATVVHASRTDLLPDPAGKKWGK